MRNGPEDVEYVFASGGCRVDPLLKADQIGVTTRKCWICPTFENVW